MLLVGGVAVTSFVFICVFRPSHKLFLVGFGVFTVIVLNLVLLIFKCLLKCSYNRQDLWKAVPALKRSVSLFCHRYCLN